MIARAPLPSCRAADNTCERWLVVASLIVSLLPCTAPTRAASADALPPSPAAIRESVGVDLPVQRDPALPERGVERVLQPRLVELWRAALERDEAELQARAARAIAEVHRRGFDGMALSAPLLARRLGEVEHPAARVALIDACAALDVREALPVIERLVRDGHREVVLAGDRAMGAMGYAEAGPLWAKRIAEARVAITLRRSAIRAMAKLREQARGETLLTVASDAQQPASLRLEAARALAHTGVAPAGLLSQARALGREDAWFSRLIGVTMLAAQGDRADAALLTRFAADASPVVAAEALRQLVEVKPAACLELPQPPWRRDDANVRYQATRCLFAHGVAAAFEPLVELLDDTDPAVRQLAHWSLVQRGEREGSPGPSGELLSRVQRMLRRGSWRGMERAALLLGRWDHKPAADRLVERLRHERAEVRVAAAAGLRRLEVGRTLPALLQQAQRNTQRMESLRQEPSTPGLLQKIDREQQQIFAAFGVMRHRKADGMLRRYLPKDSFPSDSRAAAVWALGKIHLGTPDGSLASKLRGRLSDTSLMEPESSEVRVQAAIALARLGAEANTGALRRFAFDEEASDTLQAACRWALEQLTGERQPPLEPKKTSPGEDWFLVPLRQ